MFGFLKHVSWKKVFTDVETGLAVAAPFNPIVAGIQAAVVGVEAAIPAPGSGATKAVIVTTVADALVESEIAGLTTDEQASLKQNIANYRDVFVAAQNVAAQEEAAREHLETTIAALKAKKKAA